LPLQPDAATIFTDVIKRIICKCSLMTVKCINRPIFLSDTTVLLYELSYRQLGLSDTYIQT